MSRVLIAHNSQPGMVYGKTGCESILYHCPCVRHATRLYVPVRERAVGAFTTLRSDGRACNFRICMERAITAHGDVVYVFVCVRVFRGSNVRFGAVCSDRFGAGVIILSPLKT